MSKCKTHTIKFVKRSAILLLISVLLLSAFSCSRLGPVQHGMIEKRRSYKHRRRNHVYDQ